MSEFTDALRNAIAQARGGSLDPAIIDAWMARLRNAARASLPPDGVVDDRVARSLLAMAQRAVSRTRIKRTQKGFPIASFTADRIAPEFRAELDRKILESANLIKLDRDRAIEETLQRFAGWLSSVPPTGTVQPVRKVASHIAQPVIRNKFQVHRVEIDQGHKLAAAISETIAHETRAIAGIWHDHGKVDRSYHARPAHLARTGKVYLLGKSWARERGFVKPHAVGFYEDLPDKAAELPFCRCWIEWLHNLDELPPDMLTVKGAAVLARVKEQVAA